MSLITNLIEQESQEALNLAAQSVTRGAGDAPFVEPQEEDQGEFFDLKDVAMAPIRGVEGFTQSIYNLADAVSLDALPNWENRFFGESTSTAGKFVEGTTQFLTGFIPVGGALGKAGQALSLGSKIAKAGKGVQLAAKIGAGALKGGITDFVAFDGQDERLSNLIQEFPQLQNPVTEYLAAAKDDGEIEGRFKNVIEGLFLEAGMQAVAAPFTDSLKSLKEYKGKLAEGLDKPQAALEASKILEEVGVIDAVKALDEPILKPLTDADPNVILKDLKDVKETTVGGSDVVVPPIKEESFDPLTPIEASNPSLRITDRAKRSGSQDYLDVLEKADGLGNMAEVTQLLAKGDISISAAEKLRLEGLTGEDKLATLKTMNKALGISTESLEKKFGTAIPEYYNSIFVEQHLAFTGVRLSGGKAVEVAKELQNALTRGDTETAATLTEEFAKKFQQFTEWNMLYGMNASAAGTLLNQVGKNKKSFTTKAELDELVPIKKVPVETDPLKHKLNIAEFQKEKWGSSPMEDIAKKFSAAASFDDLEKQLNVMTQLAQTSRGRRGFDALQSVWRNSILSGPASFVVNVMGGALTRDLTTLEGIIGAGLRGDINAAKSLFKAASTFQSFSEISDAMAASFKAGEDVLTGSSSAFVEQSGKLFKGNEFSGASLGFKDDSTMGQAVNWLSTISSIPSRLNVAGDAAVKYSTYARFGRAHFLNEAYNSGIKNGVEAAKYAETKFRELVLEGGKMYNEKNLFDQHVAQAKAAGLDWSKDPKEFERFVTKQAELNPFDQSKADLAERFSQITKKVTFSKDLDDISQGVSDVINKVPGLNFVIPFVKTPTNILKFGLERSPLGLAKDSYLAAFSKDFREQFINARGPEADELRGRVATAVMFNSSIAYYLMNNEGSITGGGPQNKDERATLVATGWQPYSIKIGDKYVSYQRLDPIATPLGILADLAEFSKLNPQEKEDDSMSAVFSACAMTLTYNLTDKSYLRGLNNLMKAVQDPATYLPKLVRDIGAGFVPNAINQMQNTEHEIILRDSRSFADAVLRRIPEASEQVPPQRTILGDVVYRENPAGLLGPLSPINISTAKNDPVAQELSTLNGHFGMPSSKMHGLNDLDMREFKNSEGRQAYDRWLELSGTVKINGKTLKQALGAAIKSKEYQALPKKFEGEAIEMKSPRIEIINRIIRGYRNEAKTKVLGEYPELYQKRNTIMEQQRASRLGKFENQQ